MRDCFSFVVAMGLFLYFGLESFQYLSLKMGFANDGMAAGLFLYSLLHLAVPICFVCAMLFLFRRNLSILKPSVYEIFSWFGLAVHLTILGYFYLT